MPHNLIDRDDLLTLSQAAQRLPGRPHRSTLWRWCSKGVRTPAGDRVFLRYRRLGRRTYIAPEDVEAFSHKLEDADREAASEYRTAQAPRRRPRAAAAEAEADAIGI